MPSPISIPPRRPSHPQLGNPASIVFTGQPIRNNAFVQQLPPGGNAQNQMSIPQSLLPPSGQLLSTTARANPGVTALHQYRARSPVFTVVDESGVSVSTRKHFRIVDGVTILRDRLKIGSRQNVKWPFHVNEADFDLSSGTIDSTHGAAPTRVVRVGSRFYRLRCVDATGRSEFVSEDDWVAASHVWPSNVTVLLNEKPLDVRKKIHHGRDLPIDMTAAVRKGDNIITISIIRAQKEDQREYAIGLEAVRLLDMDSAKVLMGTLAYEDARLRILQRFQNKDPDVEVVDASVTLNLADPYTSSIWNVPMRGKACRHDQCFDLDTFLETRHSKKPDQPCDPDQFHCPICGGDARPQNLVKDEFFVHLRQTLAEKKRLDAKAILLQQNGHWQVKEDEKTGEAGDGSGGRFGARDQSAASPVTGGGGARRQSEVIELDDD
ncbi:MAG: hypothetical protein Q9218_003140 [Villophora microphyllina]